MRVILLAALVVVLCAPAGYTQQVSTQGNETSQLWFVELASPPIADGGTAVAVRNDKQTFRAAARQAGVLLQERFAYDNLFNGISVRVANPADIAKLSVIPGVAGIHPVQTYALPPLTTVSDPALITALAMTGADIVQSELGFTGAGIKVGIVDSGIDYHHPDLGGCFGPGCRVFTGYDFVGDGYDGYTIPVPDPDPRDTCNGHGTHVSGIVGANGRLKGVAPGVTFGAYRIFGCAGSSADDVILAALERALGDGMDVINMSLGASYTWPQSPLGAAATRLVNKGVVVVASMGNSGAYGLYSGGAPGLGAKAIAVASFDNTHINVFAFRLDPAGVLVGYTSAAAAPEAPVSGTLPLAMPAGSADGCGTQPAGSFTRKAVLIQRGGCPFYVKAYNAQNAGAAAVVLYNNAAGMITPSVAGTPPITIPVVSISLADGQTIAAALSAGATLTWTAQSVSTPLTTGGVVSGYSSYGLAPDLTLKPDLGAPGGYILSTYPSTMGWYTAMSGTSMSSPHVAGAAALLLQAKPHTPAQMVGAILQNSAVPVGRMGSPNPAFADNVHRQGAGMLKIDSAILATTTILPGDLSLGESQAGPARRTLTIQNAAAAPVTYALSNAPALATGPNTFSVQIGAYPASVVFGSPSVTVPANGIATVEVAISPDSTLPDGSIYGGHIVFTPVGGGQVYRVPYAGFKGDYQAIQVLTPMAYGFPWLARQTATGFSRGSAGAVFTMAGSDVPYILLHLNHQSSLLRMEVFEAASGRNWHVALQQPQLPRNATSTSFFAIPWGGTTGAGNKTYTVPNGSYFLKLTVVKALGDATNPADVETWTSPVFVVARP